jgi:hypothetical protein
VEKHAYKLVRHVGFGPSCGGAQLGSCIFHSPSPINQPTLTPNAVDRAFNS